MPASFPVNCLHAVTVYQSAKMGLKRLDPDTSFKVSVSYVCSVDRLTLFTASIFRACQNKLLPLSLILPTVVMRLSPLEIRSKTYAMVTSNQTYRGLLKETHTPNGYVPDVFMNVFAKTLLL